MSTFKKPANPNPERIVILRALQLGDTLNAVPAFRALRTAFPKARIALVGLPWARGFVERFHSLLDDFISFPGFPGLPEREPDLPGIPAFLRFMQESRFDLALQMHGSGRITNPLVQLWDAKRTAGFYEAGQYCPDPQSFLQYPENEPERWRHLRLLEFLGIPLMGDELEFPIHSHDWMEYQRIQQDFGLRRDYVCVHPGARKLERRWPAVNFAAVSDGIAALGYQVVLTGSSAETPLADGVAGHMAARAVNLAGKTSLGGLAALLSSAQLLLSNDTGVSHLAAAIRTPSVILFSAPDHARWAPADLRIHKIIRNAASVTPSEVLAAVQAHLEDLYAHVN